MATTYKIAVVVAGVPVEGGKSDVKYLEENQVEMEEYDVLRVRRASEQINEVISSRQPRWKKIFT